MGMIGYAMRVQESDAKPADYAQMSEWRTEAEKREEVPRAISLEKFWQAIHFLLSGHPFFPIGALGGLIMGGDDDVDPSGAVITRHSPKRVAELHGILSALSNETLRERFKPQDFASNKIYPDIWDENEADLWSELCGYLDALRQIVQTASERGEGLLVWVR